MRAGIARSVVAVPSGQPKALASPRHRRTCSSAEGPPARWPWSSHCLHTPGSHQGEILVRGSSASHWPNLWRKGRDTVPTSLSAVLVTNQPFGLLSRRRAAALSPAGSVQSQASLRSQLTPGGLLQFSELEGPAQGPLPGSPSDTWDTWLCPRRPARRSSCRSVCGRRAQGRCWQHGGGRRHTPFLLGLQGLGESPVGGPRARLGGRR